ncbi:MAG: hypothetical protein IJR10_02320 [Clostridia bacterium]|nr:hypothetical protein [Clostridia bacterium]
MLCDVSFMVGTSPSVFVPIVYPTFHPNNRKNEGEVSRLYQMIIAGMPAKVREN